MYQRRRFILLIMIIDNYLFFNFIKIKDYEKDYNYIESASVCFIGSLYLPTRTLHFFTLAFAALAYIEWH